MKRKPERIKQALTGYQLCMLSRQRPQLLLRIISQTSSVVTKCSHIIKVHQRDSPETITWENIFSAFTLYLPGAGIEVCLCYWEAVAKETCVSQTSSIPSYFEHLSLLCKLHRVFSDKTFLHAKTCIQKLLLTTLLNVIQMQTCLKIYTYLK